MTVHASRPAPAIVRRHAGCSLSQDKPRARCQGYFPAYRAPRRRGRTRLWRSEPRHQRTAVARPEAHGDTAMCAESPQAFLVAERGPPSQRDRAPYTLAQRVPCCRLTVKLRGRATEPDWSRGRNISPSARGDTTELHGPLQRLLDGIAHVANHTYHRHHHSRQDGHRPQVLIREILSQKRSPYFSAAIAQSTPPTRQPARMWRPFQVRT